MSKKRQKIKRLKKQVKVLNGRISKKNKLIKELQDMLGSTVIEQVAGEMQSESEFKFTDGMPARFSEEEFEQAGEIRGEAEEILDILEKEVESGAKKAVKRRRAREKVKKKLQQKERKRNKKTKK